MALERSHPGLAALRTPAAASVDGKLSDSIAVTVSLNDVAETPVTACETDMGTLSASALYAGKWDDAECKAHHQNSRARYFHFTVSEQTTVTITAVGGGALRVQGQAQ